MSFFFFFFLGGGGGGGGGIGAILWCLQYRAMIAIDRALMSRNQNQKSVIQ